ncbi:MAG: hypothetical protein A2W31_13950 [Planctomycetes bacterium RBG_16_64_10]|nr:MAG: hypothetical protein A2W31_13950 [Planctomycetes bacterium RBG_16_64_10]
MYDVVVIGGGMTGAGVARDAALRGLKVALFEQGDYATGTSSKSSKLIHGGLRYLEQAAVRLVFESVRERSLLCRLAPHLVRPLPFLLPIYHGGPIGLERANLGLWIYDLLALFRSPHGHRTYRGAGAAALEPALRSDGMRGVIEYYDCITDDARLVLETILDARAQGADCRSYTQVTGLDRRGDGRVCGVRYRDVLSGAAGSVACHAVISAVGVWTDEVNARIGLGLDRPLLRPTKGVHLVFARQRLPIQRAVMLFAPCDGRVLFAIPWQRRTIVGTTDTDFRATADQVWADADDVDYLCASMNHFFPAARLQPSDVIATWAGLRPLVADCAQDTSAVSREHTILVRGDGVTIIAGGKITTYRRMAQQGVDATVKWLRAHSPAVLAGRRLGRRQTAKRPLPGGRAILPRDLTGVQRLAQDLARQHRIDPETADHLATTYGGRAAQLCQKMAQEPALAVPLEDDLPHVWAEIDFAVDADLARTIDDVLGRRLPILVAGRHQGLDILPSVADRMAQRLGWSPAVKAEQIRSYQELVATTRAFRQVTPSAK